MYRTFCVGLLGISVIALLVGCGGDSSQTVFQNVLERVSWSGQGTRLAFTSLGGNALEYVYSISNTGRNLVLLTPTDNDDDFTDEGGKQPAWAPNNADLCIVARRGGTQSLFLIDPVQGAASRQTKITNDTIAGADAQPSWKADSSQIVYVSNKGGTGRWEIYIINRDGTGNQLIARTNDNTDAQWPVFTPDGTKIIYQSRIGGIGVDTSLRVLDIATGITTPIGDTEGNGFRDEAPSVSPDGAKIAFHSNRNGDFDIWIMNPDGTSAQALTRDARSDGYPVWSPNGARIAFTRDRELWTMAADGTDQKQLTRRFEY